MALSSKSRLHHHEVLHQLRSENPDEATFCWKCGSRLYSPTDPGRTIPDHGVQNDGEGFDADHSDVVDDIERFLPELDDDRRGRCMVLRKTPERIRYRQYSMIMTAVCAVAILAVLFFWEYEMVDQVSGYVIDRESESFLEIAEFSPYGSILQILVIITAVVSVIGLVSVRVQGIASVFLILTGFVGAIPFDVDELFLTHTYVIDGVGQPILFMIVVIIIVALESVGEIFMAKCLNKDGRIMEMETSMNARGMMFNIDSDWNMVWRKS